MVCWKDNRGRRVTGVQDSLQPLTVSLIRGFGYELALLEGTSCHEYYVPARCSESFSCRVLWLLPFLLAPLRQSRQRAGQGGSSNIPCGRFSYISIVVPCA